MVQGNDANGVPGDDPAGVAGIEEHEGIHAGEVLDEVAPVLAVQGQDHLAVAAGLEGVIAAGALRASLLEIHVVVDLAVDGEDGAGVRVHERLCATQDVDDGEPFMGDDGRREFPDAGPVRPPMLLASGGVEHTFPVGIEGRVPVQQGGDGAHGGKVVNRKGFNGFLTKGLRQPFPGVVGL